jgi:hypothetical protein
MSVVGCKLFGTPERTEPAAAKASGVLWRPLAAQSAFTVQKLEVQHENYDVEAIAFLPCDTYVQKCEEAA